MADNDLQKYFMEFKIIQDIQMAEFDHDPDLEKMIFERNRAFQNLRSAISLVPAKVLKRFQHDADAIMDRDKIIMMKLEKLKSALLKQINQSAKGKQLLKGYRGNLSQSLRFMNTRT